MSTDAFAQAVAVFAGNDATGKVTDYVVLWQSTGNMGVALLFVILFLVGYVHIAPMLSPGESSPEAAFSQSESVGRLAGTLALPALLMAFLLGRLGRKSKSK